MWVVQVVVYVVAVLGAGLAGLGALWLRDRRRPRALGVADPDADLLACPRRLEGLEAQLLDRLGAVQQQLGHIEARRAAVAAKDRRDDLVRKYDQDALMLQRRAASMERVAADLWRTRSILLLRAHLAGTARRRPALGPLPDPSNTPDPARAGRAFRAAAEAVRAYLGTIDARVVALAATLPEWPGGVTVDPGLQRAVDGERRQVEDAYGDLREDMDRLADTLTWLADHCGALAVVQAPAARSAPSADPAHLLEEVEGAMQELAALARAVDPSAADAAVESLASGLTGLEEAGREAEAEAQAHLEVERLLRRAPA